MVTTAESVPVPLSPKLTMKQHRERLGGVFPMDEAVVETLPKSSSFVSADLFGSSAWTITGKITATSPEASEEIYFIKIAFEDTGRIMLYGEFESSKLIYHTMSDFIPEPFGFGQYRVAEPKTYFYLSRFVDMDTANPPEPAEFAGRLARLHRASQSLSDPLHEISQPSSNPLLKITLPPPGKFGFHEPTCDGDRAHVVDWQDSWAEFFRELLLGVCKLDVENNDSWPEFELAAGQVASKVVPRLLNPLREDGEAIKPSIVHGDLWEGNIGVNKATGRSLIFDAGSYFAHNEMELGHWRCGFGSIARGREYIARYRLEYPPAEPADEFDDRNRLYSLKGAINYSAGHPKSSLRKIAYNNMCYLCEKYAPVDGIDKYDPSIDSWLTGESIVPHQAEGLI